MHVCGVSRGAFQRVIPWVITWCAHVTDVPEAYIMGVTGITTVGRCYGWGREGGGGSLLVQQRQKRVGLSFEICFFCPFLCIPLLECLLVFPFFSLFLFSYPVLLL